MQSSDVMYIPKNVRIALLAVLVVSAGLSIWMTIHFALFVDEATELVVIGIGAAQASITGIVIVALVSFSLRMRTTRDVQEDIDDFFLDDLCSALGSVVCEPVAEWDVGKKARKEVAVQKPLGSVKTNFAKGSDSATFTIDTGTTALTVWIMVNVYRITVIYYLDGGKYTASDLQNRFGSTMTGAKASGYTCYVLEREGAAEPEAIELHCTNTMPQDFIHDPAQKLFLRNDLRQMTASIIFALENGAVHTRSKTI